MTLPATNQTTATRAAGRDSTLKTTRLDCKPSKSFQKDNRMTTTSSASAGDDGEPVAEFSVEGFSVTIHSDSRLGPIITLDDLAMYGVAGLDDDALRATMTLETWRRLKALVGVVDQALVAAE